MSRGIDTLDVRERFNEPRRMYATFSCHGYSINMLPDQLIVLQRLSAGPGMFFLPESVFEGINPRAISNLPPRATDVIAFHIDEPAVVPVADIAADGDLLYEATARLRSAAGLALLKDSGRPLMLLLVNPKRSDQRLAELTGEPCLVVRRRIDPHFHQLGAEGYLEGAIPDTSYRAVVAWAAGLLTRASEVALSQGERALPWGYSDSAEFDVSFAEYAHAAWAGDCSSQGPSPCLTA